MSRSSASVRSPSYVGAIDPSGYHLHVLTTDHKRGGHLNDVTLRDATVRVAPIRHFDLRLPHDCGFDGAPAPRRRSPAPGSSSRHGTR